MTEKVKVSKDLASAIESVVNRYNKQYLLMQHANHGIPRRSMTDKTHYWLNDAAPINDMSFDDLARALYVGYEIEQEPKERIIQMFRTSVDEGDAFDNPQSTWWDGRRMAIIDTLNALEIKIEGVNK